jgi:hypothetical protein
VVGRAIRRMERVIGREHGKDAVNVGPVIATITRALVRVACMPSQPSEKMKGRWGAPSL